MLSGKVAWITGAGTGIGLAGARELAAAGATVAGPRPVDGEAETTCTNSRTPMSANTIKALLSRFGYLKWAKATA